MQTDSTMSSILVAGQNLFTVAQNSITQIGSNTSLDQYAGDLSYLEILLALSVSAILGALIAYHPRRNIEIKGPVSDHELRKTQIVICVAGAVMVALIQGSLERAFGLVGLGSFIRYRTALRNPYDLSVIFILIGLGMACGLQYYEFALTITCFFYVLMFLLDINTQSQQTVWTFKAETPDPDQVEKAFQAVLSTKNYEVIRMKTDSEFSKFTCKFSTKDNLDKVKFQDEIKKACNNDELIIRVDWEQEIKNT